MHEVGHYEVEQPLIVSDHQTRVFRAPQLVHRLCYRFQSVYVETGVRLVQDRQLWFEHGHLEYLVALLFATREAMIHRPLHQAVGPTDHFELLLQHVHEVDRVEFLEALALTLGVHGRAQEIRVGDAVDFDRVLERQEQTGTGALFRREVE